MDPVNIVPESFADEQRKDPDLLEVLNKEVITKQEKRGYCLVRYAHKTEDR